jgi:hypothetical protein
MIRKNIIKDIKVGFNENSRTLYNYFQKTYKELAILLPSIGQI